MILTRVLFDPLMEECRVLSLMHLRVKGLEMTIVVIWRYINKLNWIDYLHIKTNFLFAICTSLLASQLSYPIMTIKISANLNNFRCKLENSICIFTFLVTLNTYLDNIMLWLWIQPMPVCKFHIQMRLKQIKPLWRVIVSLLVG